MSRHSEMFSGEQFSADHTCLHCVLYHVMRHSENIGSSYGLKGHSKNIQTVFMPLDTLLVYWDTLLNQTTHQYLMWSFVD